jgi:YesN/AraC family two-component response regulator
LLNNIIKEVSNSLPGHQKVIESITNQIVFELIRNILSKQPLFSSIEENFKFFNDEKILDLFLFIDENISKDLSNKILSDHLNISEDYVGQFFRNNIGFSPQDYIEHRRMEKAIKILREKTDAIKVISNDVGFKDTAYFCRRFKMMFGVQAGKMKKRLNEI